MSKKHRRTVRNRRDKWERIEEDEFRPYDSTNDPFEGLDDDTDFFDDDGFDDDFEDDWEPVEHRPQRKRLDEDG